MNTVARILTEQIVLNAAAISSEHDRAAFVSDVCCGQLELRARVEELFVEMSESDIVIVRRLLLRNQSSMTLSANEGHKIMNQQSSDPQSLTTTSAGQSELQTQSGSLTPSQNMLVSWGSAVFGVAFIAATAVLFGGGNWLASLIGFLGGMLIVLKTRPWE